MISIVLSSSNHCLLHMALRISDVRTELRYKVNTMYTLAFKNDISIFTSIEAGPQPTKPVVHRAKGFLGERSNH